MDGALRALQSCKTPPPLPLCHLHSYMHSLQLSVKVQNLGSQSLYLHLPVRPCRSCCFRMRANFEFEDAQCSKQTSFRTSKTKKNLEKAYIYTVLVSHPVLMYSLLHCSSRPHLLQYLLQVVLAAFLHTSAGTQRLLQLLQ